jgi:hypothetical protein
MGAAQAMGATWEAGLHANEVDVRYWELLSARSISVDSFNFGMYDSLVATTTVLWLGFWFR